jgi:phosphate starvation-inducible PhoH-like protein
MVKFFKNNMKDNIEKRVPKTDVKLTSPLSDEQKEAKAHIVNHAYSFILGKPGSGKTYLAIHIALSFFLKRQINRIIITRPTVSTEQNGHLPGTLEEKMKPWLIPIMHNLSKIYDKTNMVEKMISEESLEIVSLAHFRGRTFENSICIVDEFQNLTSEQLSMCLGRLGQNSMMLFCGDGEQIDLKQKYDSAFYKVEKLVESEYVYLVQLQENYRHPAVKDVLEKFYKSVK